MMDDDSAELEINEKTKMKNVYIQTHILITIKWNAKNKKKKRKKK